MGSEHSLRGGYHLVVLRVDLSTGAVERVPISGQFALEHIGGPGFGAALLADHMREGATALVPENVLVFAPGPLTGLPLPGAARCHITALSPETGGIGGGSIGGNLGPAIRRAGYDAVMIAGRAEKLSYLHLDEARVEIVPATDMAGSSARAAGEAIRSALGGDDYAIAAIGPAGEKQDPTAIISSGGHHCAGGMGAVMGSKNLKAIAASGSKPLPAADLARLAALADPLPAEARCPADCGAACTFKRHAPAPGADELGVDMRGATAPRKRATPEMVLLDLLGLCHQPWLELEGGLVLAAECYRAVTGLSRGVDALLDVARAVQRVMAR
jgi:aldehyde:ferredoxin oxidoreductase